jgi:carbon storage regulator
VLILTRKTEQGIVIAGEITVRVLAIEGERVKLGIEAPRSIAVLREELVEAVGEENRAAAAADPADVTQRLRTIDTRRAS